MGSCCSTEDPIRHLEPVSERFRYYIRRRKDLQEGEQGHVYTGKRINWACDRRVAALTRGQVMSWTIR